MVASATAALDMAKTVLGKTEGKDRAALIDYMKTGGQNIDPQTRAWCAAFINASLNKAGYSGTGSDLARSFLEWGNAVEPGQVQAGDIGVYPRGSDPMYGHAGIVEKVDPATGMVTMISGNAGPQGAVQESQYAIKDALGFRRAAVAQQMAQQGYSPEQIRNAIASIESQGSGDYSALGRIVNRQGDRAYGRYQVMGSNVPAWTKQVLGTEMTPEQFLADPQAQDKVFDAIYGGYVKQHGLRGAASMWFTGQPNEPDVTDVNKKLTGKTYADRFMAALETPKVTHPPNPTVGTGGTQVAATEPLPPFPGYGKERQKTAGEVLGEGIARMGAQPEPASSLPGIAKPQVTMSSLPSMPMVDPQQAETRRQMLAMMMQRLNQGSLV
jgi:uncharacterized protein (TIGR02594 family)